MSNLTITRNDLEQPDYIPQPETNPIGYDDGTRRSSTSQRPRGRASFAGVLAGAVVVGVACVAVWRVCTALYENNATLRAVVDNGVVATALVFFLFLMFAMIAAALWLQGWATERGVTTLPGGLPVHNLDLLGGWKRPTVAALAADTMQQHFGVQQTLAQQSTYRNVTAYSPSISTHYSTNNTPEGTQAGDAGGNTPPALPSGPVPPFDDLLAAGMVGRGNPLLLGIDVATGAELRGSWLDLYSTAVAGLSGGGKTTTQRFLAAQAAMHGAKFVVGDPHYGAADDSLGATLEPLQGAFLCEVADTNKRIMDVVKLVRDIGDARISGKDKDATPVILWIDEATKLLGHSQIGPELAALLEQIAQQYRKRGVYASIAGQIWTVDRTGGSSAFRDSLASVLCHRMKRQQARLLLPTDEARIAERLPTGQAVLWRTSGETVTLAIPNTTAASLRMVGERLAGGTGDAPSTGRAMGFHAPSNHTPSKVEKAPVEGGFESGGKSIALPQTDDPEVARILALFRAGKSIGEIVHDLTGQRGGTQYNAMRAKIERLLRERV